MNNFPFAEAPRAVIFDLDGTLADTFPLIVASWNAALRAPLGRTFEAQEVIARFGVPDDEMLRRELQSVSPQTRDAAIETYHAHYQSAHDMVSAFPNIDAMLRALQRRAVPLGIVTGKGRRTADVTLRELNWNELFGSVLTGDEVNAQKPDPEGVLRAARELKIAPQNCVYIGDSPLDIEAGRAAGMCTIAAAWHPTYHEKLRAARPDFWAQTPQQLADVLQITS